MKGEAIGIVCRRAGCYMCAEPGKFGYHRRMDVKPESVSAIRAYVYDYIVGMLWILGLVAAAATRDNVAQLATAGSSIAKRLSGVAVPEIVSGFLVAIGGVVLPFCVCTVLKPVSLRVMTTFSRLQRRFEKWLRSEKAANAGAGAALDAIASRHVRQRLSLPAVEVPREVKLTYLKSQHPMLAPAIEQARDDLFFRAAAALPSALLFGGIGFHIAAFVPVLTGITTGLLTLVLAAWFANKELRGWLLTLDAAIALEPKAETYAAPTGASNSSNVLLQR